MEIERHDYEWHHKPTGSKAWIDNLSSYMEKKGKRVRQGNLHVLVPEEHRGKGHGTKLVKKVVKDLGEENKTLPKGQRWYRLYVKFRDTVIPEGSHKVFEKGGFKNWDGRNFKEHLIDNYEE